MSTREHNLTLVEAKVVNNGKVQLEFVQHCPNPHKKGVSSSASSIALQAMNAGDPKFEASVGGTGNYRYWINGTREQVAKAWSIDLTNLGVNHKDVLPLNIDNPKLLPATEGAVPLDVCLKLTELKASEIRTFFSPKRADKIGADIANASLPTDFKRKGKDGAYITSNGEKIWVDVDLALGVQPTHRFLLPDAQVALQPVTQVAPAMQAVPVGAPVQQVAPVAQPTQTAPNNPADLPF